jgi:hypothetical protein
VTSRRTSDTTGGDDELTWADGEGTKKAAERNIFKYFGSWGGNSTLPISEPTARRAESPYLPNQEP